MENNPMAALLPIARKPVLENSKFYMGNLITILVRGSESGGRFALISGLARIGNEPPPHLHQWENETWYVREGSLEFFVEGREGSVMLGAGDSMFVPRGHAHGLYYRSPTVDVLLIAQADGEHPVGLDTYFDQISEPATSMELPEDATTYVMETPEWAIQLAAANGIMALSPEETARRLPYYPGFGANLQPATTRQA